MRVRLRSKYAVSVGGNGKLTGWEKFTSPMLKAHRFDNNNSNLFADKSPVAGRILHRYSRSETSGAEPSGNHNMPESLKRKAVVQPNRSMPLTPSRALAILQ